MIAFKLTKKNVSPNTAPDRVASLQVNQPSASAARMARIHPLLSGRTPVQCAAVAGPRPKECQSESTGSGVLRTIRAPTQLAALPLKHDLLVAMRATRPAIF